MKFWSFQRPNKSLLKKSYDPSQLLTYRSYNMSKISIEIPKIFTCFDFIPTNNLNETQVIVGGNNGAVFLFQQNICIKAMAVIKDGIYSLISNGNTVICGGNKGLVVIIDSKSLNLLQSYSVLDSISNNPINSNSNQITNRTTDPMSLNSQNVNRSQSVNRTQRPVSATINQVSSNTVRRSSTPNNRFRPKTTSKITQSSVKTKPFPDKIDRTSNHPKNNITTIGDIPKPAIIDGIASTSNITGICPIYHQTSGQLQKLLLTTGFGRIITIDFTIQSNVSIDTLFYYHYGPIYALATKSYPITFTNTNNNYTNNENNNRNNNLIQNNNRNNSLRYNDTSNRIIDSRFNGFIATGGDDKWLCVWNAQTKSLMTRIRSTYSIRAIDFDSTGNDNCYIIIGTTGGYVMLYNLSIITTKDYNSNSQNKVNNRLNITGIINYNINEIFKCRDSLKDISDIKFNPTNEFIAVGSHDDLVYM